MTDVFDVRRAGAGSSRKRPAHPEAVTVTATNPDTPSDYDETELAGALRIDDLLFPEFDDMHPVGTSWSSITRILGRSFDHQKIWPRATSDLEP